MGRWTVKTLTMQIYVDALSKENDIKENKRRVITNSEDKRGGKRKEAEFKLREKEYTENITNH